MSKLLCLIMILASTNSFAQEEKLSDSDKQMHMMASYAINYTAYTYFRSQKISKTRSMIYSSLLTIAVGAAKEATDETWSQKDFQADLIGTGVSLGTLIVIEF